MAKDLQGFNADLDKFARTIGVDVVKVRKKVSFGILNSLIKRTPVDTGRARASWAMADGVPPSVIAAEGQRTRQSASAEAKGNVTANFTNPWDVTYITNRLPYIIALDQGHSQQAPNGFVAIALAEAEAGILSELL